MFQFGLERGQLLGVQLLAQLDQVTPMTYAMNDGLPSAVIHQRTWRTLIILFPKFQVADDGIEGALELLLEEDDAQIGGDAVQTASADNIDT